MEGGSDPARKAILMQHWIREFQDAISQLEQCHKPVIAAVHNVAYGLAIDILSACDVRIATKDARFSVREVDAGLAADIGTLQRFPKIVANDSWVRELCYTAREFDASEAFQFGFVSRVVDGKDQQSVVAEAVAMASQMASKSPVALRNCKHLLLHARDHSVQEGLEYTSVLTAAALQSDDIPNAVCSHAQCHAERLSAPFRSLADPGFLPSTDDVRHAKEDAKIFKTVNSMRATDVYCTVMCV